MAGGQNLTSFSRDAYIRDCDALSRRARGGPGALGHRHRGRPGQEPRLRRTLAQPRAGRLPFPARNVEADHAAGIECLLDPRDALLPVQDPVRHERDRHASSSRQRLDPGGAEPHVAQVRDGGLAADHVCHVLDRLVPARRVRDAEGADRNPGHIDLGDPAGRAVDRLDAVLDPLEFLSQDPQRVRDLTRGDEVGARVLNQVALDRERVEVVAVDVGDENEVDRAERATRDDRAERGRAGTPPDTTSAFLSAR